ncbi:SusE domain-containing protein [Tellurirhabdus rosea]|uniref:SusE domain-containing protein n=1 Tax=Tellurirhabdus rosea TaxID=2674997 RepID=UPI00225AAED5|nr:SusE domain-containing protein [Tellurirhabdus rosea]
MKTLYTKLFGAMVAAVLLTSCEKDEIRAVLNPEAAVTPTLSGQNVVLNKETPTAKALTISWAKPNYGYEAAATYSILIDKKGGDFSKAAIIAVGRDTVKTFATSELNTLLVNMGLPVAVASDIDVKVQSVLGTKTQIVSPVKTFKVTPYLDRLDLSTNWGIVGNATVNEWNGPDVPFYKTDKAGVLAAYVTLKDGEIKFRQDNKWDNNYGDNGADGKAEKDGANIKVTAGTYRITLNTSTFDYKVEKYAPGLVGDATPNGWNGPDVPLAYDPTSDTWKAVVTLVGGKDLKIRLNNDWGTNWGGSNGTLAAGGDNIRIAAAGTYLVTVDYNKLKYTIETIKPWGVVGDAAPNGWNGPDAKFYPTGIDKVFVLDRVTLKAGEIKFRLNDDWGTNYGDTKADGVLDAGGDNIKVTAGTFQITLDLSDANKPTYKMVKI